MQIPPDPWPWISTAEGALYPCSSAELTLQPSSLKGHLKERLNEDEDDSTEHLLTNGGNALLIAFRAVIFPMNEDK